MGRTTLDYWTKADSC